mgnify:CR=1 FL=1|tara:strand:+ start:203 stop:511 length:309 start_codon:yes stop_codon:yes gene_type:complete
MKKIILIFSIFLLLIFTTITKNSTKNIEKKIYNAKENLRILKQKYEMVLLDFNYLSSPENLMEYQRTYFEDELKEIDIVNLKKLTFIKNEILANNFINLKNE